MARKAIHSKMKVILNVSSLLMSLFSSLLPVHRCIKALEKGLLDQF